MTHGKGEETGDNEARRFKRSSPAVQYEKQDETTGRFCVRLAAGDPPASWKKIREENLVWCDFPSEPLVER